MNTNKYKNILNNIPLIIFLVVIFSGIIAVILNFILAFQLPFNLKIANNLDWIGYWGSIVGSSIGGVITLLGLKITMKNERELEFQRNSIEVMPYLDIKIDYDEAKNINQYKSKKTYYEIFIKDYEKLKNRFGDEHASIFDVWEYEGQIIDANKSFLDEIKEINYYDSELEHIEISEFYEGVEKYEEKFNNKIKSKYDKSITLGRVDNDCKYEGCLEKYDDYKELMRINKCIYVPIIIENIGLGGALDINCRAVNFYKNGERRFRNSFKCNNLRESEKLKVLGQFFVPREMYLDANGNEWDIKVETSSYLTIEYKDLFRNIHKIDIHIKLNISPCGMIIRGIKDPPCNKINLDNINIDFKIEEIQKHKIIKAKIEDIFED